MDRQARLPLREVAWLFNVPTGTVRNWRYRGWDHNGERRYLHVEDGGYLVGEVEQAELDTRRHERSHRWQEAPSLVA